ncbi:hypothetical protein DFH09DRAFT_67353 [Mycena vulgaris]|nr:hypothetical protein DFH09DRAFT_67353 [Mycena vulgaris]
MPGITLLPANLAALVLESCLYGILLLLFILTVYFLATRRTLAGHNQSTKHHFTSLVFFGVACLFILVTAHWIIVIYQAFFAFIHLGSATAEDAFYANLAQRSEIIKFFLAFTSILVGDSLIIYRLWTIWGRKRCIIIFPSITLIGTFVGYIGMGYELTRWEPALRGAPLNKDARPWIVTGFIFSLITIIYSTGFIAFRISRATRVKSASPSGLMSFLVILVESAALQAFWLTFAGFSILADSAVDFIATDTFPVIIGISNLLIHARVGLGWSQDSVVPHNGQPTAKYIKNEDAV